jgi:hypothetical protein
MSYREYEMVKGYKLPRPEGAGKYNGLGDGPSWVTRGPPSTASVAPAMQGFGSFAEDYISNELSNQYNASTVDSALVAATEAAASAFAPADEHPEILDSTEKKGLGGLLLVSVLGFLAYRYWSK